MQLGGRRCRPFLLHRWPLRLGCPQDPCDLRPHGGLALTYRLDFAYVRARICVEYDGVDLHDTTAEQREHDAIRRRWLREHGWTLIVVRLGDFTGDALLRWIRELRCELKASYTTRRF